MTSITTNATTFNQDANRRHDSAHANNGTKTHSDNANKSAETFLQEPSEQSVKQQQNAAILQAHIDVSLSSENDPLSLLYNTALQALGEELEPVLGPDALDQIKKNGPAHYTPEATSERIVSLSTGFFDRFQQNHSDLSLQEQVESFIELITGGVDKGFGEAREILDGLGVLEGDIATNIDRTYELILQGYADFKDSILNPDKTTEGQVTAAAEVEISKSAAAKIARYQAVSSSP